MDTQKPWHVTCDPNGENLSVSDDDLSPIISGCGCCGSPYITGDAASVCAILRQAPVSASEIARLQAQVSELQKLSVRNIMLAIVPGDGSGQEIYAESVDDVVNTLTKIEEQNETLQAQVDALAGSLREIVNLCAVGDVDESTEALGWGAVIKDANAALAAAGR